VHESLPFWLNKDLQL
jgi:hypothetical protein